VLTTLGLPEDPGALLASHVTALDEALRYVGGRLAANADCGWMRPAGST
jgi:hypothetical protein